MVVNGMKEKVVALIAEEELRLGSANKVAAKCGVTAGVISFMKNKQWQNVSDEMWINVGKSLGMRFDEWQVVDTTTSRMVSETLLIAKERQLFIALAHRAGAGKSESCKHYADKNKQHNVFYIECREWGKKEFLEHLCSNLGIDIKRKGWISNDELLMMVVGFFQERFFNKPLLIIDEADKLKAGAMRSLITFYNECSDKLGVVIVGTDNLEVEMKRGVKYNRKGFDELDSRFGRNFIHLYGSTYDDVRLICEANGVTNKATIRAIFNECEPQEVRVEERFVKFVHDLRRVKRAVTREVLRAES